MRAPHPTKLLLLDTAVALIDEHGSQGFTVEQLLEESKISKGSLYHHFTDFSDVLEQAQVKRYSRYVDRDGVALVQLLQSSTSRDDLLAKINALVMAATSPERAKGRVERAEILGMSGHSKKLAIALAAEQQRLTDSIADIAREMQERGWVNKEVDAEVIALYIQAYSFGFILNDITDNPVSIERWASFMTGILAGFL